MKLDRRAFLGTVGGAAAMSATSHAAIEQVGSGDGDEIRALFSHENVNRAKLGKRSYMRWNALPDGVIPLTAADPDFPVAAEISEVVREFADDGLMGYGLLGGLPGFKEQIVETVSRRYDVSCRPEQVFLCGGASAGMYFTAALACEPGDEAILFDPVDLLFGLAIDAAGAKRVYMPVDKQSRELDFDALETLVTDRTRMLCVCNPHNPLGKVLTKPELERLAEFAVRHDLYVMSDEVWADIVFDGRRHLPTSALSDEIRRKTFSIYGFSKTFAMAGMRMGYVIVPEGEIENAEAQATRMALSSGLSTIAQLAAKTAYEKCWYWADAFLAHVHSLRDYGFERLNAMHGVKCNKPEGVYVLFPDVSSFGLTSAEMSDYLLKEAQVATVPGSPRWFGPGAEGNIRIAFCTSQELFAEGLDRIEDALNRL